MSGVATGQSSATAPVVHLLVPHPAEPCVLMLPGDGGWTLPRFPKEDYMTAVGSIGRAARELLGIDIVVLLNTYHRIDPETKRGVDAVFVTENRSPAWEPSGGGRWVGRAELADMDLTVPEHLPAIETWFAERESGQVPSQRAPWARKGWFGRATAWIEEQLARLNISPAGQVEQVKSWGISCILKVPATSGDLYFKAVPHIFRQEPVITEAMAAWFPSHVPAPLATYVGEDEGWTLLPDIGNNELRGNATVSQYEDALALLARMQQEGANRLGELLASGGADRRLENLVTQIDPLLESGDVLNDLGSEEQEQLRRLAPRLKEMCGALAGYNVPQTLAHGDFHAGNVVIHEGDYIIFDWTDACISHPFFDVTPILEYDIAEQWPDEYARLQQFYIDQWAGYEPAERLMEAWRLSQPLALLHHAVSYELITQSLEPAANSEMSGATAWWLRKLLAAMHDA